MISLACAALLVMAGTARAAELNSLTKLSVKPTADGAEVVVAGSRAPTFTVFRLEHPDRLVVDLSSADATAIRGHHDGTGPISGVVASQFTDSRSSVGRVLIALSDAARYDVHKRGNDIIVAVQRSGQATKASVHPVRSATKSKVQPPVERVAAAQPAPAAPPAVVISERDARHVRHPAKAITAVTLTDRGLRLKADGALAKYQVIELQNPSRLVLDVFGVKLEARAPRAHGHGVAEIRLGRHPGKVRVVLDLSHGMLRHHTRFTHDGLSMALSNAAPAAKVKPVAKREDSSKPEMVLDGKRIALEKESAPISVAPSATASATVKIEDVRFHDQASGGKIAVKLSDETAWRVERPDPKSAVLTLEAARLPHRLERSLDTSALNTPVKMVSVFAVPGARHEVRVVVSADRAIHEQVEKTTHGLSWKISSTANAPEVAETHARIAPYQIKALAAKATTGQVHHYHGRRLNFDFKDIDIQNLLRLISDVSKMNIVVADDVKGTVTIRLRNVPWDQALAIVLRSKGLGMERIGNIIRVAPLKTLEAEAKLREQRQASLQKQAPLQVQLIPVNFATAQDMSARVKDVLSARGTVSVDARTNTMIVRDVAENLSRARALVRALDTPTPEVLIASRIVEANTNFARQIGVQWGGFGQAASATGNPTGLSFPNSIRVGGGVSGTATGLSDAPNFAVNLPAAVSAGSGGALGFVFGSAGGALQLNLRLSAMENEGQVKTISAPKIATLDNVAAKISQGLSIPYSQNTGLGGAANTSFVQANLSLEVTPHVTQNGSILMSIHATNNQPDFSHTGANGQPSIQQKDASTKVLVDDNDTIVIGGIYVRTGSKTTSMVPFLGKIPILGFFFRNDSETETRQEMLIFITPRILNRTKIARTP